MCAPIVIDLIIFAQVLQDFTVDDSLVHRAGLTVSVVGNCTFRRERLKLALYQIENHIQHSIIGHNVSDLHG